MLALVALLVVGPERLPRLARTLGFWLGRGRRVLRNLKDELDREVRAQDIQKAAQAGMHNPLGEVMDEAADSLRVIKQDTEKMMADAESRFEGKKKKKKKKKKAPPASSD